MISSHLGGDRTRLTDNLAFKKTSFGGLFKGILKICRELFAGGFDDGGEGGWFVDGQLGQDFAV